MKIKLFILSISLAVYHFSFCPQPSLADDSLWLDAKKKSSGVEIELPSFAPIIEQLGKAVVNISIEGRENDEASGRGRQLMPGWPFELFPHLKPKQGRRFSSLGSGFVIHPDGYIVTNSHVVERAVSISVLFRDDKKSYTAEVVGSDKKTDIALLKVDVGRKLDSAVLGDSELVRPGDWVIAIGNPFRLKHTATVGIVSAISRRVVGVGPYDDFIQTDASINPGNSGGPLFNAKGEVVGVNTAIFSPGRFGSSSPFNIGIGFATPVNLVKSIISELHKSGKVVRGWLGVLIQPVSADLAQAFKLKSMEGALVADVIGDSPASRAGFKRGDVIVSYDGRKVEENSDLPLMVAQTKIGKRVKIGVIRERKRLNLVAVIKELKDDKGDASSPVETEEDKLGLSVQEITPDIARGLDLKSTEGVIVTDVAADSPADRAKLLRGDVILEISSKQLKSVGDFRSLVAKSSKGDVLLLLIKRKENTIFLTLKVE